MLAYACYACTSWQVGRQNHGDQMGAGTEGSGGVVETVEIAVEADQRGRGVQLDFTHAGKDGIGGHETETGERRIGQQSGVRVNGQMFGGGRKNRASNCGACSVHTRYQAVLESEIASVRAGAVNPEGLVAT